LKLFEENSGSRRAWVRNFQPPITGEEIMEIFNLKPSKEIGMLKEAIKEPY
jgi:tRNA nucleotidyltransferase (CCA-adding enzyme)